MRFTHGSFVALARHLWRGRGSGVAGGGERAALLALLPAMGMAGTAEAGDILVHFQCNGSYQQDILNPDHLGTAAILSVGTMFGTVELHENGSSFGAINTVEWDSAGFQHCPVDYTQHESGLTDFRAFVLDGVEVSFQQSWTADMPFQCPPDSACYCIYPSLNLHTAGFDMDLGAKGIVTVIVTGFQAPLGQPRTVGELLGIFHLHDVPAQPGCRLDFDEPVVFGSSGEQPGAVAAGDFDGDGRSDLAVINDGNSNNMTVQRNLGGGAFTPLANYAVGAIPACVAVGDLNGDGKLDIVTGSYGGGGISILFGHGDGQFNEAIGIAQGLVRPRSIAIADLNGDGALDLAVASDSTSAIIGILYNNGDGTFQAPLMFGANAGNSHTGVAVADFNGDGRPDVVVTNGNDSAAVLFNQGDGMFGSPGYYGTGTSPYGVVAGDFNHDGLVDFAVANSQEGTVNTSSNTVIVWLGDPGAVFHSGGLFRSGGKGVLSIAAADWNGDGNLDLAVTNRATNNVSVLTGMGDGTFSKFFNVATLGQSPTSIAAGDFAGDGGVDFVTSNAGNDSMSVLVSKNRPHFETQPGSVTVCPTQTALFSCSTGLRNNSPSFRWQIADSTVAGGWIDANDGVMFTEGRRVGIFFGSHNRFLNITDFYGAPDYPVIDIPVRLRCVATSPCGTDTSAEATLIVCAADVNCDGFLDFFDSDAYVNSFENGDPGADFNGDGFLDFFDIDAFVNAFETGC